MFVRLGNPEGFNVQAGATGLDWPHVGVSLWLGWFDLLQVQVALVVVTLYLRVSRAPWRQGKGPVK